jgi:hypothetical protein
VTRFDKLTQSVDGKLEVLQTVAESRVQEAAARSSRRSRVILTGLTALTVVTVAFALIDYFAGGRTDAAGHEGLRFGAFAAALVLAAILYLIAERDPLHWWRTSRGSTQAEK